MNAKPFFFTDFFKHYACSTFKLYGFRLFLYLGKPIYYANRDHITLLLVASNYIFLFKDHIIMT